MKNVKNILISQSIIKSIRKVLIFKILFDLLIHLIPIKYTIVFARNMTYEKV